MTNREVDIGSYWNLGSGRTSNVDGKYSTTTAEKQITLNAATIWPITPYILPSVFSSCPRNYVETTSSPREGKRIGVFTAIAFPSTMEIATLPMVMTLLPSTLYGRATLQPRIVIKLHPMLYNNDDQPIMVRYDEHRYTAQAGHFRAQLHATRTTTRKDGRLLWRALSPRDRETVERRWCGIPYVLGAWRYRCHLLDTSSNTLC